MRRSGKRLEGRRADVMRGTLGWVVSGIREAERLRIEAMPEPPVETVACDGITDKRTTGTEPLIEPMACDASAHQ